MAEPHTRARRKRRPLKIAILVGAMITIATAGLFLARPASAATTQAANPAAATAHARTTQTTEPDGGLCSVPGIGDIGGLFGFCSAGSGTIGDLNNICTPSVSQPEQASTGIDSMIAQPGGASGGKTLYDNYGIAGQYWAAYGLQCSDMTSLIGNNVAGMVFDAAKSLDRVTITVYQSAAGNGILTWLQNAVNGLISALGNAIYFPFLAPVVIIGAIWLAWQGLVRKRATRTIEGTMWMVVACAAAIWLIGRPADFTGIGANVSNGVTQVLDTAFAKLPAPGGSNCLPVQGGDQQSVPGNYAFTSANGLIDQNANELWSVLVCKPWLIGELGTSSYATSPTGAQTVVNKYGRQLLWAQAIATNEQPTQELVTAKQDTYVGIAKSLQANYPAVYPLFQGNQWTTRLEIAFSALFAAMAAGLLVLLISLTLIVLKLGWLLLLVAGPFFLIVGIHPGFGRVIALRWFEMLVGVLLKQVAIALVLSVLLYCYSLIMGTTDAMLPWALKILMIALVTVAVFIYRKPFTHLFSSVGYGMIGSSERAEYTYREATTGFRRATATAAGVAGSALPGVAGYRAARWARRNQVAGDAAAGAAAGSAAAAAGETADGASATAAGQRGRSVGRLRADGTPAPDDGTGGRSGSAGGASAGQDGGSGGSGASRGAARSRQWRDSGNGGRAAPPLPLPKKEGTSGNGGGSSTAGWAKNTAGWSGAGSGTGRAQTAGRPQSTGRPSSGPARPSGGAAGTRSSGTSTPPTRASGSAASSARQRDTGAGGVGAGRDARNAPPPPTRASGTGWPGGGASTRSGDKGAAPGGKPSPARFWQRRTK
jgi:TrbL/VirB6 plasmid conjugal transfer protein